MKRAKRVSSLAMAFLMVFLVALSAPEAFAFGKDFSKASVSVKNATYTGSAQKPAVTVKYNGKTLSKGDFTVSYQNNKNIGTAKVTVKPKSRFDKGSKTVSFKIYPAAPKVSVTSNTSSVTLKWSKVKGAAKYQIFQYSGNAYKKIAETTGTSYTKKGLKTATNYNFQVCALKTVSKVNYASGKTTIKASTCPGTAKKPTLTSNQTSVSVKWAKTTGANCYVVYMLNSNNSWTKKATTTSLSYTQKSLTPNKSYTFCVRAARKVGSLVFQGTKSQNASIKTKSVPTPATAGAPTLTSSEGSVTLKWSAVKNATSYAVYMQDEFGDWVRKANVTSTSYTQNGLLPQTQYTFCIRGRAVVGGKEYLGTKSSNKSIFTKEVAYPAQAPVPTLTASSSGVTLKWTKVSNATFYNVYQLRSNNTWAYLGRTTELSYTVRSLSPSTKYTFCIRAGKTVSGIDYLGTKSNNATVTTKAHAISEKFLADQRVLQGGTVKLVFTVNTKELPVKEGEKAPSVGYDIKHTFYKKNGNFADNYSQSALGATMTFRSLYRKSHNDTYLFSTLSLGTVAGEDVNGSATDYEIWDGMYYPDYANEFAPKLKSGSYSYQTQNAGKSNESYTVTYTGTTSRGTSKIVYTYNTSKQLTNIAITADGRTINYKSVAFSTNVTDKDVSLPSDDEFVKMVAGKDHRNPSN